MSLAPLAVLAAGFLPPLMEALSMDGPAEGLRSGMRLMCHGIPGRCPEVLGGPAALCARCIGIYSALFVGCAFLFPVARYRMSTRTSLLLAIAANLVMAAEWSLEYAGFLSPPLLLRAATGSIWGACTGLALCMAGPEGVVLRGSS
ncbi:MAG: hypothetical protein AVO35_10030 [Candidatus Aegiribacteria sp. MLS_C]|nr:MAG: hypothetical protein AVO35_10030 [Candidatus Aegiribacteria sp. MLS_C]